MTRLVDLKTQVRNANKHTPRGLGALRKSIGAYGLADGITVAADGESLSGSARLETLADLMPDVKIVEVETDGNTLLVNRRMDIANADDPRGQSLSAAVNIVQRADYDPDGELLAALAANDADLAEMVRADYLSARAAQLIADGEIDWSKEWQGMPEFAGDELKSFKSIVVHFKTKEDVDVFSELIDQSITEKTKSIWYPEQQRAQVVDVSQ